jgi:hypothetical protein
MRLPPHLPHGDRHEAATQADARGRAGSGVAVWRVAEAVDGEEVRAEAVFGGEAGPEDAAEDLFLDGGAIGVRTNGDILALDFPLSANRVWELRQPHPPATRGGYRSRQSVGSLGK